MCDTPFAPSPDGIPRTYSCEGFLEKNADRLPLDQVAGGKQDVLSHPGTSSADISVRDVYLYNDIL